MSDDQLTDTPDYDMDHWFPTTEEAARFLANLYISYDFGAILAEEYQAGDGTPELLADKHLADLAARQILAEFKP